MNGRVAEAPGQMVLEVDASPGFHYHHQVDDSSTVRPVAIPTLEALLEEP